MSRTREPKSTIGDEIRKENVTPNGKPALVKDFADARVDTGRGVVICSTCPVDELAPGNALFPKGVFHTFDYPFYYFSIRENAAERSSSFLAKQP